MKVLLKISLTTILLSIVAIAHANPPASSGIVVRLDETFAEVFVDENASTMLILGADMYEFCADPQVIDFGTVTAFGVLIQDEKRIKIHSTGQLTASVWPFTEFRCDYFLGIAPLATGVAMVVVNDNDLSPWLNPDRHNMNAFGISAHGALYTVAGERKQFSLTYHAMWDGLDFDTWREFTKIKLKN